MAGLEIRDIWGYVMLGVVMWGIVGGLIMLLFPILGLL